MLVYIIFGILVSLLLMLMYHKFVNLPFKKFKLFSKYLILIPLTLFVIFLIRINPAFLGSIPAILIFLFKWRGIIKFLRQVIFMKKTYKNESSKSGLMSREEALKILNLKDGASEEEIMKSYYKLLKKNHPDLGGSDWVTSQLNKAKETLLG